MTVLLTWQSVGFWSTGPSKALSGCISTLSAKFPWAEASFEAIGALDEEAWQNPRNDPIHEGLIRKVKPNLRFDGLVFHRPLATLLDSHQFISTDNFWLERISPSDKLSWSAVNRNARSSCSVRGEPPVVINVPDGDTCDLLGLLHGVTILPRCELNQCLIEGVQCKCNGYWWRFQASHVRHRRHNINQTCQGRIRELTAGFITSCLLACLLVLSPYVVRQKPDGDFRQ